MAMFNQNAARELILSHLCGCPGNRDSVSSIIQMLRDPFPLTPRPCGPVQRFPTRHGEALAALRDLGFTIVPVERKAPGRSVPVRWDVIV
jgi:hypothetical protein